MKSRRSLIAAMCTGAALVGCAATASAWPTLEWVNDTVIFGGTPSGAFDPERSSLVLNTDPTWEWGGVEWTRTGAGSLGYGVFAPDRHAVLRFAYIFPNLEPRVYERQGGGWSTVSTSGPPYRTTFGLCYDSSRGRLIVFGGAIFTPPSQYTNTSETWEWDGSTWTLAAAAGPSARGGSVLVHDSARGVTVLFGGQFPNLSNDTWEWDGSMWTQRFPAHLPPAGGAPNASSPGYSAAFDAARGVCVLVRYNGATWDWDGVDWTPGASAPPEVLRPSAAWFDPSRAATCVLDEIYWNYNAPNSESGRIWAYDGKSWAPIFHGMPRFRHGHAMAFDAARNRVLLGPGEPGDGLQADAWELEDRTWVFAGSGSELGRQLYGLAFDRARGVGVIFGGFGGGVIRGDTAEWDGTGWADRAIAGPPQRYYTSMVYDEARGVCVLFGGLGGSTGPNLGDTWEWDGAAWTNRGFTDPLGRFGHMMAYDSDRHVTVLFGGRGRPNGASTMYLNDTWEYDGFQWAQRATTGPAPRYLGAMAFDPDRHRTILHGERGGAVYEDLWEWDGLEWRPLATTDPRPAADNNHAMAYDTSRHEMILVSGTDDVVWRLRARACPADLTGDGSVTSADLAQLLGAWGMDTPADINGDGVVNAADLALLLGAWGACAG